MDEKEEQSDVYSRDATFAGLLSLIEIGLLSSFQRAIPPLD